MKKKTNLLHEGLAKAILDLHGCKSTWIESVPVREEFESETVWDGVVEFFDLENILLLIELMHGRIESAIQERGVFLRCFIRGQ
jgi:hypothetical protein